MNKKEKHKEELRNLFKGFLETEDEKNIYDYLITYSNLPGRRGNIELGHAFSEIIEEKFKANPELAWNMCQDLISYTADDAPTNNPKEFLAFCGTIATGGIGGISDKYLEQSFKSINRMANDTRWRVREAVAMGLQKIIVKRGQDTFLKLDEWIAKDNWLKMRAVAAGIAETGLLIDKKLAKQALEQHKKIFKRVDEAKDTKAEDFKALVKGLSYTLSVVVASLPTEGFAYLQELASTDNKVIGRIVKENLKKNRLVKKFPEEVEKTEKLMSDV